MRKNTAASLPAKTVAPAAEKNQSAQEPVNEKNNEYPEHFIQFKLSVGAVDDPMETEADTMADKVMKMPEQNFIQRKCAECEEKEKLRQKPQDSFIRRKDSKNGSAISDTVSSRIESSKGSGSKMDSSTTSFMQSRFGADFSNVKIHDNNESAQLNRDLSAKAFTVGNDIYFNEGEYQPGSFSGKHLLAHELSHAVQNGTAIRRKEGDTSAPAVAPPAAPVAAAVLTDSQIEFVVDSVRKATDRWGTDEEGVYRALQMLGQNQTDIDRADVEYLKRYNKSLETIINDEMSGKELQFALELINIKKGQGLIRALPKTEKEFELAAERLFKAMDQWGTDEEEIYAVLLPFHGHPNEMDKLKKVYKSKYNRDLDDHLDSELSGDEKDYAKYQMSEYQYFDFQALEILGFIRSEAQARAAAPPSIDPTSKFYLRLRDHYLKDYLASPSETTGKAAIEKIGHPMSGRVTPGGVRVTPIGGPERAAADRWESMGITWLNRQQIPPLPPKLRALPIFQNLKTLPKELGAATDILMMENWAKLKNIDVPHLLGKDNLERLNFDADVTGGGKNISQLMHWGTGVKYSKQSEDAMHELFLAYEMWHLEGFDVFGTDSLNDMIAEEQGRILGVELAKGAAGAIKSDADLLPFLNQSFLQSRAWVGTILQMRRPELDRWILSKEQKKAIIHWDENDQAVLWRSPTIYEMLASGKSVDDVKKSELVGLQIEIYALLFEADLWEKAHGPIKITELQKALIEGKLNNILAIFALSEAGKFSVGGNASLVKGGSADLGKIGAGDIKISDLK